jgi:hypothetical protein
MSLAPGATISQHTIVSASALAAWARCIRATDTRLGREVAIKVSITVVTNWPRLLDQ